MKNLLLSIALVLSAQSCVAQQAGCEPRKVLLIGQSNAVNMRQYADLESTFGDFECPANVYQSIAGGKKADVFLPNWSSMSLYGQTTRKLDADQAKLDAIVFWQGEADAQKQEDATTWARKTTETLKAYVDDYGSNKSIPIVIFQLNSMRLSIKSDDKWWKTVRIAQQSMSVAGRITVIDTSRYKFNPDFVHMPPASYQIAAQDAANVINGGGL